MDKKVKWHPAFVAALKLELQKFNEFLEFEVEHQLTKEPLRIDVVVVKKKEDIDIDNVIGEGFRKYNIFEYKSPKDYLSIDDYYMVKAYGYLYKILERKNGNKIDVDDITLNLVSTKKPTKMIEYLKGKGYNINNDVVGVYSVEGTDITTRIIVLKELTLEQARYVNLLQNSYSDKRIVENWVAEVDEEKVSKNPLYSIIMNVLMENNASYLVEVYDKMGGNALSESNIKFLDEVILKFNLDKKFEQKGLEKGLEKGKQQDILELLSDLGEISTDIKEYVESTKDAERLKFLLRLAARAESIDSFREKMNGLNN